MHISPVPLLRPRPAARTHDRRGARRARDRRRRSPRRRGRVGARPSHERARGGGAPRAPSARPPARPPHRQRAVRSAASGSGETDAGRVRERWVVRPAANGAALVESTVEWRDGARPGRSWRGAPSCVEAPARSPTRRLARRAGRRPRARVPRAGTGGVHAAAAVPYRGDRRRHGAGRRPAPRRAGRPRRRAGPAGRRCRGSRPGRDRAIPRSSSAASSAAASRARQASARRCCRAMPSPPLSAGAFPVRPGDSLWWFGASPRGRPHGVARRSRRRTASRCPAARGAACRGAVLRLAVGPADTIPPGAPLRVTRRLRYAFYRSGDGSWQLGTSRVERRAPTGSPRRSRWRVPSSCAPGRRAAAFDTSTPSATSSRPARAGSGCRPRGAHPRAYALGGSQSRRRERHPAARFHRRRRGPAGRAVSASRSRRSVGRRATRAPDARAAGRRARRRARHAAARQRRSSPAARPPRSTAARRPRARRSEPRRVAGPPRHRRATSGMERGARLAPRRRTGGRRASRGRTTRRNPAHHPCDGSAALARRVSPPASSSWRDARGTRSRGGSCSCWFGAWPPDAAHDDSGSPGDVRVLSRWRLTEPR